MSKFVAITIILIGVIMFELGFLAALILIILKGG